MTGSYREAISRLKGRGRFGELGLTRMERLMASLGNPQDALWTAHLAGTNGKGSTAAFVESIWRRAGFRVGLYTSPHLFDWRERIQIDRRWISEGDLLRHLATIEATVGQEGDPITEFEAWTALAFLAFRQEAVQRAVIETGLGGRLDATNVLARPQVTAVVTVGLDHVERLGPDLASIAFEKASIAKRDVPMVMGRLPEEALTVALETAEKAGAPVFRLGKEFWVEPGHQGSLTFDGLGRRIHARPGLLGAHQTDNAALAIAMALLADPDIPDATIEAGIREARWPGRVEEVGEEPAVILDGAKNPLGMTALRKALEERYPGRRIRLVFGCLKERDPSALLWPLQDLVERLALFPLTDERALPEEGLVEAARSVGLSGEVLRTPEEAARFLLATPRDQVGVAAGSFYLVGPVRLALGLPDGRNGG